MDAFVEKTDAGNPFASPIGQRRYRGLSGFVGSALSAALSLFAIMSWRHIAEKEMDTSGGVAFSMNIVPLLATFGGIALAVPAVVLVMMSLRLSLSKRRPDLVV